MTRIALLKCGDLKGKAYEQNGGYNEVYYNWLKNSIPNPLVNKFTMDSYDVVQDIYPNEGQYDCIMLTGSGIAPYCLGNSVLIQHHQPLQHMKTASG